MNTRRLLRRARLALWLLAAGLAACSYVSVEYPGTPTPAWRGAGTPAATAATGGATAAALPWAGRGLRGRLVYTAFKPGGQNLFALDLVTGETRMLFATPPGSWLAASSATNDGRRIVLAYAPPVTETQPVQLNYTDLYVMPGDGSGAPELVLARKTEQESYFFPVWAPDGKTLYYVHYVRLPAAVAGGPPVYRYTLERLVYPGGTPETLLENAIWPRVSPDGKHLAYVALDEMGNTDVLMLADPDGRNPVPIVPSGLFQAIDALTFTPDGQNLAFSAVSRDAPALGWLDRLLGVQAAAAHNVPSDLWDVPVAGGEPRRLTHQRDTNMYAAFAPDGRYVVFTSATGLYLANADGSGLSQIVNVTAGGTLDWVP